MMQRTRRVKILATLGPSSSNKEKIRELFEAGADVFRINMSHSSHEMLHQLVLYIRQIEMELARPIGILVDLQGPKLRLGKFKNDGIEIKSGDQITFDSCPDPGDNRRVYVPHPEILETLSVGDRVVVDDGKALLKTLECNGDSVLLEVVNGATLSSRKGISLPDTDLPFGAMTDKDIADLHAALEAEADWIALSFIQRPEDLIAVRKIVRGRAGVLSKIEKPQAVAMLDEIIDLSDAVMVARGDLGVEMPLEAVPGLQKRIVRACRDSGKPVIVATQMLESMINSPTPTRAEVSDVATAVFEGADVVMLSAESAAGDYAVEAVTVMDSIARTVEVDASYDRIVHEKLYEPQPTGADAISAAARQIVETLDLAAIICYTSSGATGLRAARERPAKPIIALSPITAIARKLSLVWGIHSVVTKDANDLDDMVNRACRIAHDESFAKPGERVVIIAGVPLRTPGSTNMLRIAYISSDGQSGA